MPSTVTELFESREVDRSQNHIRIIDVFSIEGVSDPSAAEAYGPSFGDTIDHDGVTLQVQLKKSLRIAPTACKLTVTYSVPGAIGSGGLSGEVWTLDLTAGTEHITSVEKLEDQKHFPETQDVGMVIGLTPDGRAEGIDKYSPKATLTVTKYWDARFITTTYLNQVYNLTGKVNSATFKGWEKGDLLFLGARMQSAQQGSIPVVYTFIGSSHTDSLVIDTIVDNNPVPQTISKRGWEYLWFDHKKYDANVNGVTVVREGVKGIHVAKIYKEDDFSLLQLSSELT